MGARKTKVVEVEKRPVKKPAFTPAFIGGVFASLVVIVGGAILIGRSDNGQINVNATIQTSNQANIDAGGDAANNVALVREDLRNMPNGGLVPQGNEPAPEAPPAETGTTTDESKSGTTTEDGTNASTTEATATEGEAETEGGESTPPQEGTPQ